MASEPLHICLMAGEASGDLLGSRLMRALKQHGPVRFSGIGGSLMQAEGMISLFPMETLSIMGIAEILPRLPDLIRRINQAAAHVAQTKPDIFVTIDSPDFSFRVARKVRRLKNVRPIMVHYVAPTVWAWRPKRAAKIARLYDGIMCLLPFEPTYFTREGMIAAFTGHPVLESGLGQGNGLAFREAHNIPADAEVLGLFFGSRRGELKRMGPVLHEAAEILASKHPRLHIISPTLPHLRKSIEELLFDLPCTYTVISDPQHKADAFAAMHAALATSGTIGLELAIAGVPHAIGYKTNPLTAWIIRRKIKVRYAHLVNLLLDRPAVPEFLQENCTPAAMADAIQHVIANEATQNYEKHDFAAARSLLQGNGKETPSEQAAIFIRSLKT